MTLIRFSVLGSLIAGLLSCAPPSDNVVVKVVNVLVNGVVIDVKHGSAHEGVYVDATGALTSQDEIDNSTPDITWDQIFSQSLWIMYSKDNRLDAVDCSHWDNVEASNSFTPCLKYVEMLDFYRSNVSKSSIVFAETDYYLYGLEVSSLNSTNPFTAPVANQENWQVVAVDRSTGSEVYRTDWMQCVATGTRIDITKTDEPTADWVRSYYRYAIQRLIQFGSTVAAERSGMLYAALSKDYNNSDFLIELNDDGSIRCIPLMDSDGAAIHADTFNFMWSDRLNESTAWIEPDNDNHFSIVGNNLRNLCPSQYDRNENDSVLSVDMQSIICSDKDQNIVRVVLDTDGNAFVSQKTEVLVTRKEILERYK